MNEQRDEQKQYMAFSPVPNSRGIKSVMLMVTVVPTGATVTAVQVTVLALHTGKLTNLFLVKCLKLLPRPNHWTSELSQIPFRQLFFSPLINTD